MLARGGRGAGGGGLEDLLQPGQTQEVEGRHLYVGLVAVGHVDSLSGLHQLLHDLQSVLTTPGNTNIFSVRSGYAEVHRVVVVTVTLHAQIHSHGGGGGDLHDMDELAGGDVNWPGAQALLRGNNPDLDYWSCRSIFSLMGVMGGTGQGGRERVSSSPSHSSPRHEVSIRFPSDRRALSQSGRAWLGLVSSRLASPYESWR